MRIACIGECMVEFAVKANGDYQRGFAGDTFNTAWYLRKLVPSDWHVDYVSAVGDDQQSHDMLSFMKNSGVGTSAVRVVRGATCGLYTISLRDGERSFSYWRGESAARRIAEDDAQLFEQLQSADCVYFSGITVAILPDDGKTALLKIVRDLRLRGKTVAFDPNIRMRLWRGPEFAARWITEAYKSCSVAFPSLSDEIELFGDSDAEACAKRIRAAGVEEVVVKDGSNACLVSSRIRPSELVPTSNVKPVDTTGAGDSFNAGYLSSRLSGAIAEEAAQAGHRIAKGVIMGRGALVDLKAHCGRGG